MSTSTAQGVVGRGIKVAARPTLGVIALAKKNQYQGEIRQLVDYYRQRLGRDSGIHLMLQEEVLYGYAGCLATCMLNEAGITTACEADVPAGLSMFILRLLSGGPSFSPISPA